MTPTLCISLDETADKAPAELKKKARDQYTPFVNESVNVPVDRVTPGSGLAISNRVR
jgi:hypothetical protein